jgi:hypothetical protein
LTIATLPNGSPHSETSVNTRPFLSRLVRVLCMLLLFEVGVILLFLPWLSLWDRNYFLSHYSSLRPFVLNPSVRGVVTGLGALDILVAAGMLRRHTPAGENSGS